MSVIIRSGLSRDCHKQFFAAGKLENERIIIVIALSKGHS